MNLPLSWFLRKSFRILFDNSVTPFHSLLCNWFFFFFHSPLAVSFITVFRALHCIKLLFEIFEFFLTIKARLKKIDLDSASLIAPSISDRGRPVRLPNHNINFSFYFRFSIIFSDLTIIFKVFFDYSSSMIFCSLGGCTCIRFSSPDQTDFFFFF